MPFDDRAGDGAERLREAVVGIGHRRHVGVDLRDAIERGEGGLRGGVDERRGAAGRPAGATRSAARCSRANDRVGWRVRARRTRSRRRSESTARRRCAPAACAASRAPSTMPVSGSTGDGSVSRYRPSQPVPCGERRVAGGPDVGALEMRTARVRIAGALDDRQTAGVEDRSSGRGSRGCSPSALPARSLPICSTFAAGIASVGRRA